MVHSRGPPPTFEDLLNVFPAVLMCCLQVVKLLAEIVDFRPQICSLDAESLLDLIGRAEDKPGVDV